MFFDSHKKNVALILDIGNGSVGVALALMTENDKPTIIASTRSIFSFEEKPDVEKLRATVYDTLKNITPFTLTAGFAHPYFKNHSKKIEKVLCVLSSPWFISRGKTVTLSQEKTFLITKNFLNSILSKEVASFEEELNKNQDIEVASRGTHIQSIEKSIMGTRINGYAVKNPIGQKAHTCEVSVYISVAESDFLQAISKIIFKSIHVDERTIFFHSFTSVAFSTISDLFPLIHDYVHIDIAGEITDIAYISSGMIKKTASFPSGTNLLLRRISKRLGITNEVARSFFHLYVDKRAGEDLAKDILQAVTETETEWNVYFKETILSLIPPIPTSTMKESDTVVAQSPGSKISLPENIFLTAYPHTADTFSQFLKVGSLDETSSWRTDLSIIHIGLDTLSKVVFHTPPAQGDPFLDLECFFLSKF